MNIITQEERFKEIEMTIEFGSEIGSVKLGIYKNDLLMRLNSFCTKHKLIIMKSRHNILIKQKDFDSKLKTKDVALFTFDNDNKLIAVRLNNLNKIGFKGIKIEGRKLVKTNNELVELIKRGKNYKAFSICPELNKQIDLKNKECDITYYSNCLECKHRSQQRIQSEFSEFNCFISYDIDNKKDLELINLDYGHKAYEMFWFINEYGDTEI